MSLSGMFTLFLSNESRMKTNPIRSRAGRATVSIDSDDLFVEVHVSAEDIAGAERLIACLREAVAIAKQTQEVA